jgi:hypothetical protein
VPPGLGTSEAQFGGKRGSIRLGHGAHESHTQLTDKASEQCRPLRCPASVTFRCRVIDEHELRLRDGKSEHMVRAERSSNTPLHQGMKVSCVRAPSI